jgi:hypothetical protein
MDSDPRLDKWFQEQGRELEKAMRDAGTPLPQDLSGELLARGLLEEAEERFRSPEGLARAKQLAELMQQVAAELPGGHKDPAFLERIQARMREVFGPEEDGSSASA